MRNKLSRFATPYVIWMAIFVVAPIIIMVVYAFTGASGGFIFSPSLLLFYKPYVFGKLRPISSVKYQPF